MVKIAVKVLLVVDVDEDHIHDVPVADGLTWTAGPELLWILLFLQGLPGHSSSLMLQVPRPLRM
jgi:hypothetical protein